MADEETQQEQNVDDTGNDNPDEAQIEENTNQEANESNNNDNNEDQQPVDNDNNDSNVNENVDNVDNINKDEQNLENADKEKEEIEQETTKPKSDNNDGNDSDQDVIDASKDIKFKAPQQGQENDVVVVEAKTDHDNALKEEAKQDDYKRETEVREIGIPSLITIRFDSDKYLGLQYKNDQFAFYQVRICCDTDKKTSWDLYLRYSDIDRFHTKLSYLHNRLCKFNAEAKKTLILPKIPPKKQWQRNKLDKTFINDRINLLNIYFNEVTKYVAKSTVKIQDLYLSFFEISNNLYKYVINNDTQMLNELNQYNQTILTTTYDNNNANIFHYASSQNNIDIINWLLTMIDDKKGVIKQLGAADQYHFTPITLAKYQNHDKIYEILTNFVGDDGDSEQKQDDDESNNNKNRSLPAQYKTNVLDASYKRLLWIIINPFSGTGQGITIWENLVKPFLDFNSERISYETLVTTKQFHAQQECEKLSSEHKYNGILCLGGDGTIAEVINGLYFNNNIDKDDSDKNKLCVTPIPGGSGNALAKELGMDNILIGLKRLLIGFETCIDAYLSSQVAEKDTYSFVSAQWGAISTIDLESESYRWMGSFRFTLKAVSEVAWSSHYKARIYFKPCDYDKAKQELEQDKDKLVDENDREINNDENWWRKLPNLYLDDVAEHKVEEVPLNDQNTDNNTDDNTAQNGGAPAEKDNEEKKEKQSAILPGAYPSDWLCVQGEFGLCCVTNLQWIAEDTCMGGKDFDAKTNTLRLVYNKKTGRMDYASALLGLDTGKHLELENVKYFDVTQAVIEPLTKGPPMDVDGERKPLKPVYVKLLPSDFVVTC